MSNSTYLLVPAAHVLRPDFAPLLRSPESVGGAREPFPRGHSSAICVNTRELRLVIARVFMKLSAESRRGRLESKSILACGHHCRKSDFNECNHLSGSEFTIVTKASNKALRGALLKSRPTFAKSRR